ncbi:hypothetical protein PMAYCL1PPCAC_19616, partial [Pristionchus mayeri]
ALDPMPPSPAASVVVSAVHEVGREASVSEAESTIYPLASPVKSNSGFEELLSRDSNQSSINNSVEISSLMPSENLGVDGDSIMKSKTAEEQLNDKLKEGGEKTIKTTEQATSLPPSIPLELKEEPIDTSLPNHDNGQISALNFVCDDMFVKEEVNEGVISPKEDNELSIGTGKRKTEGEDEVVIAPKKKSMDDMQIDGGSKEEAKISKNQKEAEEAVKKLPKWKRKVRRRYEQLVGPLDVSTNGEWSDNLYLPSLRAASKAVGGGRVTETAESEKAIITQKKKTIDEEVEVNEPMKNLSRSSSADPNELACSGNNILVEESSTGKESKCIVYKVMYDPTYMTQLKTKEFVRRFNGVCGYKYKQFDYPESPKDPRVQY